SRVGMQRAAMIDSDFYCFVDTAMAMKMGKHCFTQKPLTHSIWEARRLGEIVPAQSKPDSTEPDNECASGPLAT
ncbi:hypothetical protein AB1L30_00340, partial [Bremerella sp. JC817]